jgi:hypothetical protein
LLAALIRITLRTFHRNFGIILWEFMAFTSVTAVRTPHFASYVRLNLVHNFVPLYAGILLMKSPASSIDLIIPDAL